MLPLTLISKDIILQCNVVLNSLICSQIRTMSEMWSLIRQWDLTIIYIRSEAVLPCFISQLSDGSIRWNRVKEEFLHIPHFLLDIFILKLVMSLALSTHGLSKTRKLIRRCCLWKVKSIFFPSCHHCILNWLFNLSWQRFPDLRRSNGRTHLGFLWWWWNVTSKRRINRKLRYSFSFRYVWWSWFPCFNCYGLRKHHPSLVILILYCLKQII